jgi:hypothetical protein
MTLRAALLGMLSASAVAAPVAGGARERSRCEFRGFHQVAANREAVLLKERDGFAGCYRKAGRLVVLADFEFNRPPRIGVLSGRFAASDGQSCDRYNDDCEALVEVRNLKTRKSVTLLPGFNDVTDIVLRSTGSIAVIATSEADTPQVWVVDRAGQRLVDGGPGVEPGTMALAGRTVYWMRAGVPVSVVIDSAAATFRARRG